MNSLNKFLLGSSLVLFTTADAYTATTFGTYAYGSDLEPVGSSQEDGGAGFTTASVSASTYSSIATLGGTSYTPILKAEASSAGVTFDDDVTQSRSAAFQTYTSSISQTITLF